MPRRMYLVDRDGDVYVWSGKHGMFWILTERTQQWVTARGQYRGTRDQLRLPPVGRGVILSASPDDPVYEVWG